MESINIPNKPLKDYKHRQLKRMAMAMRLPSKYKKTLLIELIQAKLYKTDLDVCNIIHRVKQERLRLSKLKKQNKTKRSQTRKASKKNSFSPAITETPKRPSENYMEYNQDLKNAVVSLHLKRSLLQNNRITDNSKSVLESKFTTTNEGDVLQNPMPVKRQRMIIYPREPEDNVPKSIIENVSIHKVEGTYTGSNTVVAKNNTNLLPHETQCRNTDINIQNVINESIDANLPDNSTDINASYPTVPHVGIFNTKNNEQLYRDYTQPLYVQANTGSGINNNHLTYVNSNNLILETIYNIKTPIAPLRKIANTNCVNSTQIIVFPRVCL